MGSDLQIHSHFLHPLTFNFWDLILFVSIVKDSPGFDKKDKCCKSIGHGALVVQQIFRKAKQLQQIAQDKVFCNNFDSGKFREAE